MSDGDPRAIDARGLLCPKPVLLLARAAAAHPDCLITVLADDPAAATDIPAWCQLRGARLISVTPLPQDCEAGGQADRGAPAPMSYAVHTAAAPA